MIYKQFLILILPALTLFGCQTKVADKANTDSVSAGGKSENSQAGSSSTNVNGAVNAVSKANANFKPVDASPKRIAFSKGANWGAVNITLTAGSAQKFVVRARKGQTMDVEVSSKETSVNLIKGKAATTEDFGFLTAELQAGGDFVFEVRNSTKKEIKTSVKVTVEDSDVQVEKEVERDQDGEEANSDEASNF